jgi:hypothetical protein
MVTVRLNKHSTMGNSRSSSPCFRWWCSNPAQRNDRQVFATNHHVTYRWDSIDFVSGYDGSPWKEGKLRPQASIHTEILAIPIPLNFNSSISLGVLVKSSFTAPTSVSMRAATLGMELPPNCGLGK